MYVFAENLKDFQCHFVSSCRGFHIIYPRCSQGVAKVKRLVLPWVEPEYCLDRVWIE